jgi:hypothetical protein
MDVSQRFSRKNRKDKRIAKDVTADNSAVTSFFISYFSKNPSMQLFY